MAVGAGVLLWAGENGSFALFVAGFTWLFVVSGVGNGSTYKMIPAVFARQAEDAITSGRDATAAFRGLPPPVRGPSSASPARRARSAGSPSTSPSVRRTAAGRRCARVLVLLAFYGLCAVVLRAVYLRGERPERPLPAAQQSRASHVR
ncbi:hypothetical protein GCM10023238_36820 [Streptomyces heliomycini]